ncbi:hypothetical protein [Paenibacillus humicus]|uniref:hypothetical protein n=1 Tax=Paenibacillus humicus TaxID=412861 RepID=UPI000FD94A57|nr:hypothetical protein [Paenibacillus humicus]
MAQFGELNAKVTVDVSEAISALKAIQREAKRATADLREMEAGIGAINPVYYCSGLRDYSTLDLEREIAHRKIAEEPAEVTP